MWKISQIAQIFEYRHALGKEHNMCFKCSGLPIVDRGGVDAHSFDLPFTHKPGRRLGMQAREMECSHRLQPSQLCAKILLPRWPVSGKARVE